MAPLTTPTHGATVRVTYRIRGLNRAHLEFIAVSETGALADAGEHLYRMLDRFGPRITEARVHLVKPTPNPEASAPGGALVVLGLWRCTRCRAMRGMNGEPDCATCQTTRRDGS